MRVAITGSTGLIGSAFRRVWEAAGHDITAVVRHRRPADARRSIEWRPSEGTIDAAGLEGHETVVHLAGESIFGLWTAARRRRILVSRTRGTRLLAEALARLQRPPSLLLSASAFHYYAEGEGGPEVDETSPPGRGFLAQVTQEWEAATAPAEAAGIRVVHMRFGLVLSRRGGALAAMLPVFRLGLGGPVGGGRQVWSWIVLDEIAWAALHLVGKEAVRGPVNFVTPNPVTNREFTHTLGRVVHRPTPLAAPAFAVKLAAGQMGEELLLMGARVRPHKLLESGYSFRWPDLELALRDAVAGKV